MKALAIRVSAILIVVATLSGCASSLSGLGGSERLSCKAPEGVICTSVSGVYANTTAHSPITSLNSILNTASTPPSASVKFDTNTAALNPHNAVSASNAALRSAPRVLRLWIAPWEDSDGDLHEESTVNVLVDNGRWLLTPVRAIVRSRIDAVTPPLSSSGDTTTPKAANESPVRDTLALPGGMAPVPNALPR